MMNKITLTFINQKLESEYRDYRLKKQTKKLRRAIILVILFFIILTIYHLVKSHPSQVLLCVFSIILKSCVYFELKAPLYEILLLAIQLVDFLIVPIQIYTSFNISYIDDANIYITGQVFTLLTLRYIFRSFIHYYSTLYNLSIFCKLFMIFIVVVSEMTLLINYEDNKEILAILLFFSSLFYMYKEYLQEYQLKKSFLKKKQILLLKKQIKQGGTEVYNCIYDKKNNKIQLYKTPQINQEEFITFLREIQINSKRFSGTNKTLFQKDSNLEKVLFLLFTEPQRIVKLGRQLINDQSLSLYENQVQFEAYKEFTRFKIKLFFQQEKEQVVTIIVQEENDEQKSKIIGEQQKLQQKIFKKIYNNNQFHLRKCVIEMTKLMKNLSDESLKLKLLPYILRTREYLYKAINVNYNLAYFTQYSKQQNLIQK